MNLNMFSAFAFQTKFGFKKLKKPLNCASYIDFHPVRWMVSAADKPAGAVLL
jgi:hypothetical protein